MRPPSFETITDQQINASLTNQQIKELFTDSDNYADLPKNGPLE